MSIKQLNIYGADKVQVAIDRLRAFEPKEGYYLCFSGGKERNGLENRLGNSRRSYELVARG